MGGFFNIDGPFYRIGNIIADTIILSLLWILFCIPIFTAGAATTAVFYVTTRRIANREGYLIRDFWKSFRTNFKQSTLVWLLLLLVSYILYINIRNIDVVGDMKMIVFPMQICFSIELLFISLYVFPLIARFDMKFKDLIRTAFFMANKHIFTSILCVVSALAVILIIFMYPLFFLVAIGVYAFATSYFFMRVFRKYRPDLDADDELLMLKQNNNH